MPLRSVMMPRFGTIGATEMRFSFACNEYLLKCQTCKYRKRRPISPKQTNTNSPAAATRRRNFDNCCSVFLISVMQVSRVFAVFRDSSVVRARACIGGLTTPGAWRRSDRARVVGIGCAPLRHEQE